jgi:putative tricarboxylic transport membrane protein
VICTIGAYTVHNNTFNVVMMLVFGVAGYLLKKCNYPLAPLVLAIVLGDRAGGGLPAVSADLAGQPGRLLVERAGEHDHDPGPDRLFWPLLSNLYGRLLTPALHK